MARTFVIIDGSSLIHRAFYALPLLTTQSGYYTNAVYGFTTMLIRLITDVDPEMIVVAFDKGRITFRNDAFADYKAQRKPTPSELSQQFPLAKELLSAFGITSIEHEGYEADDIIGTLATKAATSGYEVIIVTGDKDALQLIGPSVKVMLTRKGISEIELVDTAAFTNKYGFPPQRLIDLKGLMGDSSDNIPGVPGVGEKTACKLIQEFQSLEHVLENIDKVSGNKLREKLRENAQLAVLSKQLATIFCDMPLNFTPEAYTMNPDYHQIQEVLQRLEFKSLASRLPAVLSPTQPAENVYQQSTSINCKIAENRQDVQAIIDKIKANKTMICYPIAGNKPYSPDLYGMAVYTDSGCMYITSEIGGWNFLLDLLADEDISKITYNAKVLANAARGLGVELKGLRFDVLIAAYLLDPTAAEYPLEVIGEKYLQNIKFDSSDNNEANVASIAAEYINLLYPVLREALANNGLMSLNDDLELPLVNVLSGMESVGIRVDIEKLNTFRLEILDRVECLLAEIYNLSGREFNVNSTKQLGAVLFDDLKLPSIKKTKTGYSTNAEVLEMLSGMHPIIDYLLEYRMLTKLQTTYLEGMRHLVDSTTGRIHTSFNQTVTATGRLSSSDPNLQNIPVRTETGKKIRKLFVPGDDFKYIMSADYSQIELRLLAHMSQDINLLEAFNHNQDVHTRTAAEVFDVPIQEVSSDMRARAKAVNFGIIYGISDYGLSRDLKISRKEAAQYIDNYFRKYQGVRDYIDKVVGQAKQQGYVTTMFGRKRYLPDINSSNFNRRSFAERTAMNTPIQGTAADVIKKAMINVFYLLKHKSLQSRLLLQVHDELVLEVVEEELTVVADLVKLSMENVVNLSVPLLVDVKIGDNWAQAK